jgi:hypothetical protein
MTVDDYPPSPAASVEPVEFVPVSNLESDPRERCLDADDKV